MVFVLFYVKYLPPRRRFRGVREAAPYDNPPAWGRGKLLSSEGLNVAFVA